MEVEVLYFGMIAEATGTSSEALNIDADKTVSELHNVLVDRYPKLDDIKFQIAVNEELVDLENTVPENAKVALLPPFAGG